MRFTLMLLAVLGITTALPQSQRNADQLRHLLSDPDVPNRSRALEEMLLELLEGLREIMVTGSDDIPVLDPLHIEHILVDDSILPIPGANVAIYDLRVSELSTFVINSLSLTMVSLIPPRYRLRADAHVPVLNVDADKYDLSLNVLGLNVFGRGDAEIVLVQPRIKLNTLVGIRLTGGLFIDVVELDLAFSLQDIRLQINGLFYNQEVSDFVSLFLQNLLMELLEFFEVEVNEFLSTTVHELAKDLLTDFDLMEILG